MPRFGRSFQNLTSQYYIRGKQSTNRRWGIENLHTWLKVRKGEAEKDNRPVTATWGRKLKVKRCTSASAIKEISTSYL